MNIITLKNMPVAKILDSLRRPTTDTAMLEEAVNEVFTAVRREGDKAVLRFTKKFDNVALQSLIVTSEEIADAVRLVNTET